MDDKYTAVYLSDAIEHITNWLCEEELRKNIHPNRKLNQFLATDMLAKCPRIAKKTEPQTDYERGKRDAWKIAQTVFDSTLTLYEAEDIAKQMDIDWKDQMWTEAIEDEPQTERSK